MATRIRHSQTRLLVAVLCVQSTAQALQPLSSFVESANKHNPDNRHAAATVQQREAQQDVATAALLPTFTAQAVATRNQYESEFTFGGRTFTLTPQNGRDAFLTLWVPILNIAAWEQRKAATLNTKAAEASLAGTGLTVELSVTQAYFQLLSAEAMRAPALTSLAYAERHAERISDRLELGAASELDLQRARAEVQRAKQNVAVAEQDIAMTRRALESLSRLAPDPTTEDDYAKDDLRDEAPLSTFLNNRSELLLVRPATLATAAAKANLSAAHAAWLPTFSGQAQERFTNATGFSGHRQAYTLTATATWRLDFSLLPNVKAQNAAIEAARANEDKARRAAEDAIYRAWHLVRTGIDKARAARAQLAAATLTQSLARDRYEHGVVTQLELIQAERDYYLAAVSAVQADTELKYARTLLSLASRRSRDEKETP